MCLPTLRETGPCFYPARGTENTFCCNDTKSVIKDHRFNVFHNITLVPDPLVLLLITVSVLSRKVDLCGRQLMLGFLLFSHDGIKCEKLLY